MNRIRACWCVLVLALCAAAAQAQEPRIPYVPTPQDVVEKMLQVARVSSADYLIDLGSGDGRIVVTAARKYGARGFGVDINPTRVSEAMDNANKAGVADKAAFYQRDLFQTDFRDATVISMYLLPKVNQELRPKLLDLKPGTRIVSHDFDMGDWKPDTHVRFYSREKHGGAGGDSEIYFWVVPAKLAGTWRWELPLRGKPQAYTITLSQSFQTVSGHAAAGGRTAPLSNVRLSGDEISFVFTLDLGNGLVRHEYKGRADGDRLSGSASLTGSRTQGRYDWEAERAPRSAAAARDRLVKREG